MCYTGHPILVLFLFCAMSSCEDSLAAAWAPWQLCVPDTGRPKGPMCGLVLILASSRWGASFVRDVIIGFVFCSGVCTLLAAVPWQSSWQGVGAPMCAYVCARSVLLLLLVRACGLWVVGNSGQIGRPRHWCDYRSRSPGTRAYFVPACVRALCAYWLC